MTLLSCLLDLRRRKQRISVDTTILWRLDSSLDHVEFERVIDHLQVQRVWNRHVLPFVQNNMRQGIHRCVRCHSIAHISSLGNLETDVHVRDQATAEQENRVEDIGHRYQQFIERKVHFQLSRCVRWAQREFHPPRQSLQTCVHRLDVLLDAQRDDAQVHGYTGETRFPGELHDDRDR